MAQLKDGTIVNGTITATLFNGTATSAKGYYITTVDSINIDTQTNGMYLCNSTISITDINNSSVSLTAPVSVLIESLGNNKYMQTLADYSNNVYRRIVNYTNPATYKWKKL